MNNVNDSNPVSIDILVVDDNIGNLELLVSLLTAEGYNVRPADSGELALRSVQAKMPALILLDVRMPDIDGFEICRRLKADKKTNSIPVIFITALNSASEKIEGFQAGCADFITKPYNKEEIIARVSTHVKLRLAQLEIETSNNTLITTNTQLEAASRFFGFLSEVNQTIVRVKQRDELFQAICRLAVEFGKFRMAWIGLIDADSGDVKPFCHCGYEEGYLAATPLNLNDKQNDVRPTLSALLGKRVVYCEDVATSSLMPSNLREEALKRGYLSFAVTPLMTSGRVVGNLNLYSAEAGFFSQAEQRLLAQIGGDISLALDFIKNAEEHHRAEEALKDSEVKYRRLFETAQDGILILNGDNGKIVDANPFIQDLLSLSMEELKGDKLWEIGELKDILKSKLNYQELQATGYKRWSDLPLVTKSGKHIYVEVVANAYLVDHSKIIQCNIRDMTESKLSRQALQHSEERFKAMVANAPIGIATSGPDKVFLTANEVFCKTIGYDESELKNMTFKDLTYPEDIAASNLKMADIDSGNISFFSLAKRYIKKDGTVFTGRIMVSAVSDPQGTPVLYIAELEDITESKQAEESLKQSERNYRDLAESISDVFFALDCELKYVYWNKASERLTGIPAGKALGKRFLDIFPENEVTRNLQNLYLKVIETQEPKRLGNKYPGEHDLIHEISVYPSEWGVSVFVKDVTLREKAEQALKESEAFSRELLENAPNPVLVTNPDSSIRFVNPAFETITGFTHNEVIGHQTPYPWWPKEDIRELEEDVIKGRQKEINVIEKCYRHKNGGSFWVTSSIKPVISEGAVKYYISNWVDITEHKRMEEENVKLQEKAQVSARLASVGEMAAGIAHEINNPLTGVLGFSKLLLERQNVPEDIKEDLKIITEGSQRVADIVRRLLTFARQTKPVRTSVNLNELIDNTLKLRDYVLKTANIEVVTRFDPDLPWCVVDPGQLQQVFMNLIVNAEYAMKEAHGKGTLTITTKKKGNNIRISFQDDGTGITKETKARLFHPFFTTKEPGEGTGLGLGLSRSIILEHNGELNVESEEGKGATFIIDLPIVNSRELEAETTVAPTRVSPSIKKQGKVLVIDDEPSVRRIIARVLTSAGHTVDETGNPPEVIHKLSNSHYDLVFIDIRMLGISGIELYYKILENSPTMAEKMIFITGDVMGTDVKNFLTQNNLPYLAKPFNLADLKEKVAVILESSNSEGERS